MSVFSRKGVDFPRVQMAFQGSLKELPLPDIVQLVSASGKTGKFTLSQDDVRGYIFLKSGQIVHAELGDLTGEEAIYALAIWNQGDFLFVPGDEPSRQTISKSNTNLLMEAARRVDEWRVLSKKISSVDLVPELHPRENRHEQITLNPQEWLVITRINGRDSIAQISAKMKVSSFDVAKTIYGLITSELVSLRIGTDQDERDAASGDFLALADRIRAAAEECLGEAGQKSIEKYYRVAAEAIRRGDGSNAVRELAEELEKTTSLLGGALATERLRTKIAELVSHPLAAAHDG